MRLFLSVSNEALALKHPVSVMRTWLGGQLLTCSSRKVPETTNTIRKLRESDPAIGEKRARVFYLIISKDI